MERIEYEKPVLKDIKTVSYGICNPTGSGNTDPVQCNPGSSANVTCNSTGHIAGVNCGPTGNTAGTTCDPTGGAPG